MSKLEKAKQNVVTLRRIKGKRDAGLMTSIESDVIEEKAFNAVMEDYVRQLEQPRNAADDRHKKNRLVKNFVLSEYRRRHWPSKRKAAQTITPLAEKFSQKIKAECLRTPRAEQTVYEWILNAEQR